MKRFYCLFLIFFTVAFGQPIKIEKSISKDSLTIAERVFVNFKISLIDTGLKANSFYPIEWEKNLPTDIELKEKKIDKQPLVFNFTYSIACYDTGWFSIAPFQVGLIQNKQDSSKIYFGTDSIRLYVQSILPDSAGALIDNKLPVAYPFPWLKIFIIVLSIAFVILLFIYFYSKYRNKEKITEKIVVPERPAHEIAFEKLNEINPEKIYSHQEAKIFQFNLSYIFREYLENRYGQKYLEKTTFEIKPLLKNDIKNNNLYHKILNVLNSSDEIKFAKKECENSFHNETYDSVIKIIRETMVRNLPTKEEKNNKVDKEI